MKIVLIAAVSADGFIDSGDDARSTDWTSKEDTRFFIEKTKEIGTVIMGRTTFETLSGELSGRELIVLTRTPDRFDDRTGVTFTNEAPQDLVRRLENDGIAQAVLAGGASVYSQFLGQGLVDELFLTVEPVLFGSGKRLCELDTPIDLTRQNVQTLGKQSVLLRYKLNEDKHE